MSTRCPICSASSRASLLCILEGESIDADFENGRTLHLPVEPGKVFFVPAGARETAVNRSSVRFREILIELKG